MSFNVDSYLPSPIRSTVGIQVGAAPVEVDPDGKGMPVVTEDMPLKCIFRIANESFTTDRCVFVRWYTSFKSQSSSFPLLVQDVTKRNSWSLRVWYVYTARTFHFPWVF